MVINDGQESGNAASGQAGETWYCASCGIAEVDDIKLTACDANCLLVRYCSGSCQREHRPQHKEECKKRVAEWLKCVMYFSLLSLKAATSETAQSAFCHCLLTGLRVG